MQIFLGKNDGGGLQRPWHFPQKPSSLPIESDGVEDCFPFGKFWRAMLHRPILFWCLKNLNHFLGWFSLVILKGPWGWGWGSTQVMEKFPALSGQGYSCEEIELTELLPKARSSISGHSSSGCFFLGVGCFAVGKKIVGLPAVSSVRKVENFTHLKENLHLGHFPLLRWEEEYHL